MNTQVTLIDGGLSTALEVLGNKLDTSLWSGELLRSHSEQIRAAHKLFVDAGAKVLITSSYQVSYPGCFAVGWSEDEVDAALLLSTELARFEGVQVATSVGPYGAYLADGSEYRGNYGLSKAELKEFHRARLSKLIESAPDLLAIETIPELTEASAILDLLHELGNTIPFWISFSCKSETELCSGELFADAVALVMREPLAVGVGINCTAPELITPLLQSSPVASFVLYPNSGRQWDAIAKQWIGDSELSFSREDIEKWIALGAKYIGGCCGVAPSDIKLLAPILQ